MMHRYFLIEPLYSNPDTFCSFTIGSGRVRANIQIFANDAMLEEVALALVDTNLTAEEPDYEKRDGIKLDNNAFDLRISVIPTRDERRIVRFRVFQGMVEDDAPFMADIRFWITASEASEFSDELRKWLGRKDYSLDWQP